MNTPTDKLTPEQDAQLARVGQWVIETCLLFGTQRKTAYLVAGAFLEGLEREWLAGHTNAPVL